MHYCKSYDLNGADTNVSKQASIIPALCWSNVDRKLVRVCPMAKLPKSEVIMVSSGSLVIGAESDPEVS